MRRPGVGVGAQTVMNMDRRKHKARLGSETGQQMKQDGGIKAATVGDGQVTWRCGRQARESFAHPQQNIRQIAP
ncbi:hypothetical protein GCM10027046_30320 [Uliginosibacterium flavum]